MAVGDVKYMGYGTYAVRLINKNGSAMAIGTPVRIVPYGACTINNDTNSVISGGSPIFYGASVDNTDNGTLYINYTSSGDVVSVYKDSGRSELVAQGSGAGAITLAEQNASGLTGAVTVSHNAADDTDITATSVSLDFAVYATQAATEYQPIGFVMEAGIADGSEVYIGMAGTIVPALIDDTSAAYVGNWVQTSDSGGARVDASHTAPSEPVATDHMQQVGHCLQTKAAGTDVVVYIVSH